MTHLTGKQEAGGGIAETAMGSLLVGAGVFALCLLGIVSRAHVDLATFWPANAFVLGLLVRYPALGRRPTWLAAAAGFALADAATGSPLVTNLVLNGGNLATIATGYLLMRQLPARDRTLRRPESIPLMMRAVLAASLVAGMIGLIANPLLFERPANEGFAFWFATELVNYTAFLPMLLAVPPARHFARAERRAWLAAMTPGRIAPLASLLGSFALTAWVGGPGAFAFPIPALLWCALAYGVFPMACLAFLFGAWTMLALRVGMIPANFDLSSRAVLISVRLGVTFTALGPLVVASVMATREELLEKVRNLADRDAMTGLRNRRAFYEAAGARLARSAAGGDSAAVMMLDLDHFKAINDTYGHEAGDHTLAAFGRIVESEVRPTDVAGRIGGEEFAIVLTECSMEDAAAVATRINARLKSQPVQLPNHLAVHATVSIGVHVGPAGHGLDALLRLADKALYRAKSDGRDRFVLSGGAPMRVQSAAAAGGGSPLAGAA